MIPILGIGGKARHGKDLCARLARDIAYEQFGTLWGQYAFAWPLKAYVYATNSFPIEDVMHTKSPRVRRALMYEGNINGRDRYGDDYWVRQAELFVKYIEEGFPTLDGLIISDIRFLNEVQFCQLGGRVRFKVEDELAERVSKEMEANEFLMEEMGMSAVFLRDMQFYNRVGELLEEEIRSSPGLALWIESDRPTLDGDDASDASEVQFDTEDRDAIFDGIIYNNQGTTEDELKEQLLPYVTKLHEFV